MDAMDKETGIEASPAIGAVVAATKLDYHEHTDHPRLETVLR